MRNQIIFILIFLGTNLLYSQVNPVVNWKFEEGSGNTTVDIIKGLEAQIDGPNWGAGFIDNGLTSTGYKNRISASDEDYLDLTTEGAVAIWFNIHSYLPFAGLVHKGEKKNWRDEAYTFQFWDQGKKLTGAIFGDNKKSKILTGESVLEKNTWYFGIFTWDQNNLRIYLNGELYAETTNDVGSVKQTDGRLQIGCQLRQSYNNNYKYFGFDGIIDEVSVYDQYITLTQASQIYQTYLGTPTTEPGIQANWGFAEGNGGTALDSINNLSAELINGTLWDAGVNGTGIRFDGADDYARIPDAEVLNPVNDITISVWVKWSIDPATGANWANIINKDGENQYQIQHSQFNDYFEFAIETENGRHWIQSLTGPEENKWYHIAATYSSQHEEMSIFVNGVKEKSRSQSGKILQTNSPLLFGKHQDFGRYFSGVIDEVKIYNKLLTDEEIENEFLSYNPQTPPANDLVIRVKLNENEGTIVNDVQKRFTGELQNSPEWVDGIEESALHFNGDDQWISFANTQNLSVHSEITLMAWAAAEENKEAKIIQKGDWDGHSLGIGKWNGWKATVSIGQEAHTLEWNHGRPVLGEWYFLAVTYDGSTINFYVNGELGATKSVTGALRQNTRPLCIGSDNGGQKFFKGKLDELTLLNFSLSEEDIIGYYNTYIHGDVVWTPLEISGFDSFPYSFDINSQGVIFSGNWGGAGVYKSSDNGTSWENLTQGYWVWTVAIDDNDYIYVGTGDRGIIKSTDDGVTWDSLNIGIPQNDVRDMKIHNGDIYISCWGGGILKSTDEGLNWNVISDPLPTKVMHTIAFDSQGRLWAGAYDGFGLFYTDNDGISWNSVEIPYKFIWSIDFNSNDALFVGTFGGPEDIGLGLYITEDFGQTWDYTEAFQGLNIYGAQFVADQMFVLTWENGIYSSSDAGFGEGVPEWLPFNAGLMSGEVSAVIDLPDGYLLLATSDSYIYKSVTPITSVEISNIDSSVPEEFKLEQNYPNPFNPTTNIQFSINEPGVYSLVIFNAIGEKVALILHDELSSGKYEITFKAENLPSGIYYYSLSGKGNVTSNKMVLLK